MKAVPLTYSKDMQEDKQPVFDAFDTLTLSLAAITGMLEDSTFDTDRMEADADSGFTTATDLADWLVRKLDMPFREAHHVTGMLVRLAEGKDCDLAELSLVEMQAVERQITDDVFSVLSVERAVASRVSFGGAAPNNVRLAVNDARKRFLD